MDRHGSAFFVKRPRTIDDLRRPHLLEQELGFEIVKTVRLGATDFDNFTADLLADRAFLEECAATCSRGRIWRCILVTGRNRGFGVLVVPENGCFVGWAAYTQMDGPRFSA